MVSQTEGTPYRGGQPSVRGEVDEFSRIIWNAVVLGHSSGKLVRFNIGAFGKCSCSWRNIARIFPLLYQNIFLVYCGFSDVAEIFRFLPSPYTPLQTFNKLQNYTFRKLKYMGWGLGVLFWGVTLSQNSRAPDVYWTYSLECKRMGVLSCSISSISDDRSVMYTAMRLLKKCHY
jgi:hypothetical protein